MWVEVVMRKAYKPMILFVLVIFVLLSNGRLNSFEATQRTYPLHGNGDAYGADK